MPTTATPPHALETSPAPRRISWWDSLALVVLGLAGGALSYDALRQTAVAIHVRPALTYLFPLVIDGFIAYGVRALLVLRNAPFRSRLYVWTLFATATTASVWANALHAIRLNQQTHTTGLHLGDTTVGILSTIAPLALAGAVHLHILITRTSTSSPTPGIPDVTAEDQPNPRQIPDHQEHDIQHTRPELPAADQRTGPAGPVRRIGRPPSAELDELLNLARPVLRLHETPTRALVREHVRAAGHTVSEDRLTQLMTALRGDPDRT